MRCLRAWIIAASLLSISAGSYAAGLGKLNVMSALGEPLKAEVELVAEKNESGSLAVRLANREAFERAGLAYSPVVASIKVSIEKRASGEPYVQIVSSQSVSEPFIDLLLELSWGSGRISREFTALLDPREVIAQREKEKAAAPVVRPAPRTPTPKAEPVPPPAEAPKTEAAKPEEPAAKAAEPVPAEAPAVAKSQPQSEPQPRVETIGGSQPTLLGSGSALPSHVVSGAAADAYGPVKSGDTLGKIASATKPAEFTLEQMLVLLVRNNPDAFSGKNMNRLKTGKILQLPGNDQLASISATDASKEVKVQARDWRAYREQLAATAGQAAPAEQPAQQSASGKIGGSAEDKAVPSGEQPKEVLKLSKNEPTAAGGDAKAAARVRALEEEVVAREKAVKESDGRVARLEKQIKDLQALLEIKSKGLPDPQKPAATAPNAAANAPPQTPPQTPAVPASPARPTEAKSATSTPVTPAPVSPAPATPAQSAPAPSQPEPVQPKPAPAKPASVPPAPSLMDQLLDQPAYLGAAIGVLIILGALAVRAVKRRRESKSDAEESAPARAFAEASGSSFAASKVVDKSETKDSSKESSEEVDPVAEAEIFLAYGRDAQAEELLKEALEHAPQRHEVRMKLLQIYANRKDAKSFEKVARDLQQATGGKGEMWEQAAALGYQIDAGNPRYESGKEAAGSAAAGASLANTSAEDVDFNIGSEDANSATATDIDLGEGGGFERTQIIDPAAGHAGHDTTTRFEPAAAPAMDFNVDLPPAGATDEAPAVAASTSSGLDFDIDLHSLTGVPGTAPAAAATPVDGGLDFDMSGFSKDAPVEPKLSAGAPEIDLSGISLDLGTETSPAMSPTGKDDHWYDVQTKFDLAKAYQEMGDKDGAREILKEVLAEGDAEQKSAAESVLSNLEA